MQTEENVTVNPFWVTEESLTMLNRGYLLEGETVIDAIDRICGSASKRYVGTKWEHVVFEGFKNLIMRGWIGFSSPVWANMGTERGLPISCFNVHIPDTMEGITDKLGEVIMQTKYGGGTSGYFGDIRTRGSIIKNNGKAGGPMPFMQLFDTAMNVVGQGGVRRGAFAAYLDIDNADIEEFLSIKDIGNPIQNLFTGVNVPDYWMQEMIDGDKDKRKIWARVLESRQQKGLPYIFFTDNVERGRPQIYKDRNLDVNASNLCAEIMLPSTENESFVCCLSSMNLELYDEWKDTDAVFLAILFLDAILSEFIEKTADMKYMQSARNFAIRHRAVGLGTLGYHSYLQKNMIPFESFDAGRVNARIFKQMKEQTYKASEELGKELGFAPIFLEGETTDIPRRNTTTMALAPTTSNASILGGASPTIEPFASNYYKAGLSKGNFMRKNKYLQKLFKELGIDNEETWRSVMLHHGSVQHLEQLTPEQKAVFKTFKEISPMEIITKASQRQQFIDQAQSLNLQIPSTMPVKDVNHIYIESWKKGVKTLYYQRSSSVSKEMMVNFVSCAGCEA